VLASIYEAIGLTHLIIRDSSGLLDLIWKSTFLGNSVSDSDWFW